MIANLLKSSKKKKNKQSINKEPYIKINKYKNISLKKIKAEKIWIIKICRVETANSIDRETANELNSVFKDFDEDKVSLVAILTGKGKYFCSGADLNNIKNEIDNFNESKIEVQNPVKMNEISENNDGPLGITRFTLKKPVIAAINGPAVAGGFELILWCDLRVTYRNCEMGIYCRKRGVPLIDGATYRLQKLIGLSRSMDLILTGRRIDGNEGYSIGLINRIRESREGVMSEAKKLALEIIEFPQECMQNDRISLLKNTYENVHLKDMINTEYQCGIKSLKAAERMKNEINRFLNKKKKGKEIKMMPKF